MVLWRRTYRETLSDVVANVLRKATGVDRQRGVCPQRRSTEAVDGWILILRSFNPWSKWRKENELWEFKLDLLNRD